MDFAGWIATWQRVVTQPGEPVFLEEKSNPNGTLQTALIWMVIAGVIAGIFGAIAGAVGASSMAAMLDQADLPPEVLEQIRPLVGTLSATSGLAAIITVPLFFLIGTFILHFIAKMFGGQGEFNIFAYLTATFQAPLTIVSSILSVIPVLGGCVSFLIVIYTYILSFFAVKANYGLTSGRAVAVILIPIVLLFVLAICFGVLLGGVLASMGGN
jgi:hypothetical protein